MLTRLLFVLMGRGEKVWPSVNDLAELGKQIVFGAHAGPTDTMFKIERSNDQNGLFAEVRCRPSVG